MKKKIILASASPRRRQLLKKIITSFTVAPSKVDESQIKAKSPGVFAVKAAIAKAEDVARHFKDAYVIGADTIVVLGKKILGKPKNEQEAIVMLKSLRNRTHEVVTGLCIVDSDTLNKFAGFVVTEVKMKKVSDQEILDYVKTGKPLDKAGAYGIQEIGKKFIDSISGDYDNVVGLPIRRTKELLEQIAGC